MYKNFNERVCSEIGKFKCHFDASGREEGLLKPSEYRRMGEEGIWPNRHITFIVVENEKV